MSANVMLTGAVDDARGLPVSIYQDHAAVRIDAGGAEITFEIGALQTFMHLLADAAVESRLWDISQAAQLDAAVRGITGAGEDE